LLRPRASAVGITLFIARAVALHRDSRSRLKRRGRIRKDPASLFLLTLAKLKIDELQLIVEGRFLDTVAEGCFEVSLPIRMPLAQAVS
jgi:hypothetical protein